MTDIRTFGENFKVKAIWSFLLERIGSNML